MFWEFYINMSFRYKYLKTDTNLHCTISIYKIPNGTLWTKAYWEPKAVTYFRKKLHSRCLARFSMRLWWTFKLRLYPFRPQPLTENSINSSSDSHKVFLLIAKSNTELFHATQLTTSITSFWCSYCYFQHISKFFLVFLLLTWNKKMSTGTLLRLRLSQNLKDYKVEWKY